MYQIEMDNGEYIIVSRVEFDEFSRLDHEWQQNDYFNFLAANRPVYYMTDE